jgi:Protein of unknown function (DUF3489)
VGRRQFRKDGRRSAMKTFYIHANKVVVSQSRVRVRQPQGAEKFGTERELAKLALKWPAARLHEIWNVLPGTRPVTKFADRKTAVHRIWNEIQNLEPVPNPRKRAGTKADQILALLRQPSGATLQSITKATGWQAHSVRGFISGHLVKKMKLRVQSFRRDGERVYRIR